MTADTETDIECMDCEEKLTPATVRWTADGVPLCQGDYDELCRMADELQSLEV